MLCALHLLAATLDEDDLRRGRMQAAQAKARKAISSGRMTSRRYGASCTACRIYDCSEQVPLVDNGIMDHSPLKLASSKKRVVFRIQLTTEAKDRIQGFSDRLGITQIALTSKIVEWFANQPDMVQAAILGLYPDLIKTDVAEMILAKMAGRNAA